MTKIYIKELNSALHDICSLNKDVVVLGEDIEDPYGGAFKVTKGLSSSFPSQVRTSPISEAALIGLSGGMALRGLTPIVEIMFGDFLLLCMDQIVNYITKYASMYADKEISCPIVIRTPMGGGRGYGPTHSQSLEKYFFGIPGLKVIFPSVFHNAGVLLKNAIDEKMPVLFIEHKALYSQVINEEALYLGDDQYPVAVISNFDHGDPDIVMITYGGTSLLVPELLKNMISEEIRMSCIVPSCLNFIDAGLLYRYIKKSKVGCLVVEEGTSGFNWGAEIIASIVSEGSISVPFDRVSTLGPIIPCIKSIEKNILPGVEMITRSIYRMFEKRGAYERIL